MPQLTNEQKAQIYNQQLFKYQKIQEQIREIKASNFELSEKDEMEVKKLENIAKRIYDETRRLYN